MTGGIVYLVGAGPGDPGLITVRGLECIRTADVLVYDRLVSPALLAQCQPGADLINVGKEPGRHGRKQEEISRLLADLSREGRVVCRLKGGDPFVFGRGGEEADLLAGMGLPFEVVPGVTAGLAATAYAGIPATHRDYAASAALVTGHEAPCKGGPAVDWARLAHSADTLLIYMGLEGLADTTAALIAAGRSPETPAAAIRCGTRAEQETVTAALKELPEAVQAAGLRSPALIVVGAVVALREKLAWAEARPLFGNRVLLPYVTGVDRVAAAAAEFRRLGAEVWEWPVAEGSQTGAGGVAADCCLRRELRSPLAEALQAGLIHTIYYPSALAVRTLVRLLGDPALLGSARPVFAGQEAVRAPA